MQDHALRSQYIVEVALLVGKVMSKAGLWAVIARGKFDIWVEKAMDKVAL